jgi:hypothetical protein
MNISKLIFLFLLILFNEAGIAQNTKPSGKKIDVGVARIDITPYGPIRLSGYLRYGSRINESEGVLQQLWAKAIAFGSDAQGPSVIITVDLAGIQLNMVKQVGKYISTKTKFNPDNLSICASHTHSGPDMGNSHNMYFHPVLPVDQLARIAAYLDSLAPKLEKVALEALHNRKPSYVSWTQGQLAININRRAIKNGKWVGHGKVPDGPVDHSFPMMRITDTDGNIKSIFVSYACHGNTLFDNINKTHGDWIGEAQRLIEANHPGAIALVAQGCAGDTDPLVRGSLAAATQNGQSVADEVEKLLATPLTPLNAAPTVRAVKIQLPFDHVPDVAEFTALSKDSGAQGRNAEVYLDRIVRGIPIDSTMTFPIECWTFGKDLAMVFLADEMLSGYSLRIREELGTDKLWINAYTNDVKAYVPTKKVIPEGGYEVESNMYYYDHPFRFSSDIEDIIIKAVHNIVPANFHKSPKKNAL